MKKGGPQGTETRRVFVDSGGWIALFSARDQHHAEADLLFRRAFSRKISLLTSNLVLAEVHRLLLFRAGNQAAGAAVERIEASSLVEILFAARNHHSEALRWMKRLHDQKLTYTDAVSFALMTDLKCSSAMSFDHHFLVAGFNTWRESTSRSS